ncbi:universal stress protein, partial [Nonomuraea sp. NPDC046570]|uniref:universal stress protein n=1 Tax=Nonomuraea sp. NPDC046570 TaxID=3155255 RepID=UPI0033F685E6
MTGRIVVGVDGSASAGDAVDWAADDASRRGQSLRIVHICEQFGAHYAEGTDYCREMVAAVVERARERAPGVEVTPAMLAGNVIETLNGESESADCIVLGSRGLGGFTGLVLGSVGLGVAAHASGPVIIVHHPPSTPHGEIVVGFDGSEHAAEAMGYAIEQARARSARLHVVYAWQAPAV